MRYFFYILLCFWMGSFGLANAQKVDILPEKKGIDTAQVLDFMMPTGSTNNPFSQNRGIGSWVSTPYGQIRLLSSDSGAKGVNRLWMALQVNIQPEFYIKAPVITITKSDNVKDTSIMYPVTGPLEPVGLYYQGNSAFLIRGNLITPNKPFEIDAELSVEFCTRDNLCLHDTQSISMHIGQSENYYSPFSSFIDRMYEFVPQNASAEQLSAGLLSDDTLWIRLHLKNDIHIARFLILNQKTHKAIPYQIQSQYINVNSGLFILKLDALPTMDVILLTQTQDGSLMRQMTLQKSPVIKTTIQTPEDMPSLGFLWIFLLLISPTMVLLLTQNPRNEIQAPKQNALSLLSLLGGILCWVPLYLIWPASELAINPLWTLFGLFFFLSLGYRWIKQSPTRFGFGVLAGMLPIWMFLPAPPSTFEELLLLQSTWALLNILPFFVLMLRPAWAITWSKWAQNIPETVKRYPFFLDAFLFGYLFWIYLFKMLST